MQVTSASKANLIKDGSFLGSVSRGYLRGKTEKEAKLVFFGTIQVSETMASIQQEGRAKVQQKTKTVILLGLFLIKNIRSKFSFQLSK